MAVMRPNPRRARPSCQKQAPGKGRARQSPKQDDMWDISDEEELDVELISNMNSSSSAMAPCALHSGHEG